MAAGGRIRLVIADEHALFRQALRIVLEREHDLEVVGEARTGSDAVVQAERARPDVAVISAMLSGVNGVSVTAMIRDRVPGCRVIVLTDETDQAALHRAIESGSAGYLTKEMPMTELIAAIRDVHRGDTLVPPHMLGPLFEGLFSQRREQRESLRLLSELSRREQQVLRLLVDGAGNEEIGRVLVISPQTARTHIQRVIRKLGVHSRLEAAMLARQMGIVDELPKAGTSDPIRAAGA
jgi:two-component system, NarL family, response regulator LiaR